MPPDGAEYLSEETLEFIKSMTQPGYVAPKKRCKSFHGYTSNPGLCKACNRPTQEHPEFMEYLEDKKREAILETVAM